MRPWLTSWELKCNATDGRIDGRLGGRNPGSDLTRRKLPTYYSRMTTPDIFAVLANPVRRRILELLIGRPCTVNQLVDQFQLNRPAVSEHLQVLRKAKAGSR